MSTFGDKIPRTGQTPEEQGTDRPKGWKPSMDSPIPPVRCVARTERGSQCNQWSNPGSEKCNEHSTNLDKKNAADRVAAGRLRLIGLIDPAIDTLQELLEPGTGEAVRLKAATEILDRSGLPKGQDLNIQVEHNHNGAEVVAKKLEQIRKRKQQEEVIEVEEVEDNDS